MMKSSIFFVGSQNLQFGFVLKWVAKKMISEFKNDAKLWDCELCNMPNNRRWAAIDFAAPATFFNGHMAVPQFVPEINGGLPMAGRIPNFNGCLFRETIISFRFNLSISGTSWFSAPRRQATWHRIVIRDPFLRSSWKPRHSEMSSGALKKGMVMMVLASPFGSLVIRFIRFSWILKIGWPRNSNGFPIFKCPKWHLF